jgi:hypothetical protein
MGVHGNGLTALLWMNPSPRATVIEFFFPGGFAHDYEYTTRALGMIHYGFWGSEYVLTSTTLYPPNLRSRSFTSPGIPLPAYPPGFQGMLSSYEGEFISSFACRQRNSNRWRGRGATC